MAAPKENKFWELRSKHGRDKLFSTPKLLWAAACEYFEWCDSNPLHERKAFAFQGAITTEDLPKLRAYTMEGLCLFLDCNEAYFRNFKSQKREHKQGFSTVIERIERVIYYRGGCGSVKRKYHSKKAWSK